MTQHLRVVHGHSPPSFPCPVDGCEKSFTRNSNLKVFYFGFFLIFFLSFFFFQPFLLSSFFSSDLLLFYRHTLKLFMKKEKIFGVLLKGVKRLLRTKYRSKNMNINIFNLLKKGFSYYFFLLYFI